MSDERKPTLAEAIAQMDAAGRAAVDRLAKAIRNDRAAGNLSLPFARAEYSEILRELNPPLWVGAAIKDYAFQIANDAQKGLASHG